MKLSWTVLAAVAVLLASAPMSAAAPPSLADAIGKADVAQARSLIQSGADVNAADDKGVTPLHIAAASGKAELVEMLIAAGAKVDAVTTAGQQTPLLVALQFKYWDSAKLLILIAKGAKLSATPKGARAFSFALYKFSNFVSYAPPMDADLARTLVRMGATTDLPATGGGNLLHLAATAHEPGIILAALEAGADPNGRTDKGETPLLLVTDSTDAETWLAGMPLALAMAQGASPGGKGRTGGLDSRSLERQLRRDGITDPYYLRNSAIAPELRNLLAGAKARRAEAVTALLAHRADPRLADKEGQTPLHNAARDNDPALVTALIAAGADPNVVRPGGFSPLMLAAFTADPATAQALLAGGAQVDLRNSEQETALMRAAIAGGDDASVAVLLAAGAQVDAVNKGGQTALIYAVGGQSHILMDMFATNPELDRVVARLLAAGADPRRKDASGKSALDYARANPKYRSAVRALSARR